MSFLGDMITNVAVKRFLNLNPSHCKDPARIIGGGHLLPFQVPQGSERLEYSFGGFQNFLLGKKGG